MSGEPNAARRRARLAAAALLAATVAAQAIEPSRDLTWRKRRRIERNAAAR
ncbi:hypothetical protein ACFOPN_07075 [Xanthomonas hyacinthi]|uniref:hypothetical protein n=1 Tax=Xanthomonas hyacinthi TaxID=56455 RepID=UPI000ACB3BBA|nr:hypothetical protein [Xanthomonas hyacinthi]